MCVLRPKLPDHKSRSRLAGSSSEEGLQGPVGEVGVLGGDLMVSISEGPEVNKGSNLDDHALHPSLVQFRRICRYSFLQTEGFPRGKSARIVSASTTAKRASLGLLCR